MATRVTIKKRGADLMLPIPGRLAQRLGLAVGTRVELTLLSSDAVIIRPIPRQKSFDLAALLSQCRGRNPHRETIRGRTGGEIF
jgi:antitoxin component of MazEF toxin-antitoxin module